MALKPQELTRLLKQKAATKSSFLGTKLLKLGFGEKVEKLVFEKEATKKSRFSAKRTIFLVECFFQPKRKFEGPLHAMNFATKVIPKNNHNYSSFSCKKIGLNFSPP